MTDYDVLLSLGFGTPAVDQQSFPTFGTLISCVTMSFRILCKVDTSCMSQNDFVKVYTQESMKV